MVFPLTAVLSAAPGIISAATDIIRLVRTKKDVVNEPVSEKLTDLEKLIEKQAVLIEELAVNNRNLALAVRNNRIVAVSAIILGCAAGMLAVYF